MNPKTQKIVTVVIWLGALVMVYHIIKAKYWNIRRVFNPLLLENTFTPSTHTIHTSLRKRFEGMLARGIKEASRTKVVIAGMLRDVAPRVKDVIKKTEGVGKLFKDYTIIVVENDSSDGTRDLLLEWTRMNPKVKILGCGVNAPECKLPKTPKTEGHPINRSRMDKMTLLRNIYLDYIKQNLQDYDYAIFWDLDAISVVYHDGILNTIGQLQKNQEIVEATKEMERRKAMQAIASPRLDLWATSGTSGGLDLPRPASSNGVVTDRNPEEERIDAVCAYGIYEWPGFSIFYDTFAYEEKDDPNNIDYKYVHDIKSGVMKMGRGEPLVEVNSCFSGFAIYRVKPLLEESVRYGYSPSNNIVCEHTTFHNTLKGKKTINPSLINVMFDNP
jgi:hypothetical protein